MRGLAELAPTRADGICPYVAANYVSGIIIHRKILYRQCIKRIIKE
jgi:hypothetical protein